MMQGMQNYDQDDQLSDLDSDLMGDDPGSVDYDFGAEEPEDEPGDFYENLCHKLQPEQLNALADQLFEEIGQDKDSRSEWEQIAAKAIDYLGIKVDEFVKAPFENACGAYDNSMATVLFHAFAEIMGELFPAKGPAKLEIMGQANPQLQFQGEVIIDFINNYLTRVDKGYTADSRRLIIYSILFGSCFRKVYVDPVLKTTIARMVMPQDFLIDNNAVSIATTDRMTHIVPMSRKDIVLREKSGVFLDCKLPEINDDDEEPSPIEEAVDATEGLDKTATENRSTFNFYETYVNRRIGGLDDKIDKDIPLPYCVSLCCTTRKIVSIVRNWRPEDMDYKRKDFFVEYQYLPGFGMYGLGLAALMCSQAIVLTAITRSLVNSGLLNNHAGGLIKKGLVKAEKNDIQVGLGEFQQIETGEMPINQVVMPMPFNPPSVVLKDLASEIRQNDMNLGMISLKSISESMASPNMGQALGLAILDLQSKVQSTILRGYHFALGQELQLIYNCFRDHFPEEPHLFDMPGKSVTILKSYFSQNIGIVPVSDPDLMTNTQRAARIDATLGLVSQFPQLFNARNVVKRALTEMHVNNIDEIMEPDQQPVPLDPVSENALLIQGKPVQAFPEQDHDAHMTTHSDPSMQQLMQSDPQKAALVAAHNQQHAAMKYVAEMQAQMGGPMPPPQQIAQDMQLQNQIAVMSAQIVLKKTEEMKQQAEQNAPPNPTQVMQMDIEQRREAAQLRAQFDQAKLELDKQKAELQAEADRLKAEVESFKATTNFETEKLKIKAQKEISEEKNDVALEIAERKQHTEHMKHAHDVEKSKHEQAKAFINEGAKHESEE